MFSFSSGHEVVIVKGGQRVCGSGCALGNAPLVQSKSYFEVKLQQGGVWAIGLATRNTDLDRVHGMLQNPKKMFLPFLFDFIKRLMNLITLEKILFYNR